MIWHWAWLRNLGSSAFFPLYSHRIVRPSSHRCTMVPLSLKYVSMYVPGIRNVKFSSYLPSYARTQVQQKKFRLYDHLQCIVTFSYNRTIIVASSYELTTIVAKSYDRLTIVATSYNRLTIVATSCDRATIVITLYDFTTIFALSFNSEELVTGTTLSEALIRAATNPQHDKLQVQDMKTIYKYWHSEPFYVQNMFWACTELVIQWTIFCHVLG